MVTAKRKLALWVESLTDLVKHRNEELTEWVANFMRDPSYALLWATTQFKQAAELALAYEMIGMLGNVDDLDEEAAQAKIDHVKYYLTETIIRGAKYPSNSTSATNNLTSEAALQAKAELLERFK